MNDLAERYVQAVLRAVPSSQRADLEREIRALVADAIEAKAGETGSNATDAERAALADLGDPALLAGRYTGRTAYLIGPSVYPEWRRILSILLPIIVPVIGAVVLAANLLGGSTVGEAIVDGGSTAFNVAVQTLFWFTVVFAVIERTSGSTTLEPQPWSPDSLPELESDGATSTSDFIGTVVANVLLLVGLLVVQLRSPIVIDGANVPLFDPALWSFWLPWFIVVTLLEIGLAVAIYARRRWTYGYAIANALLGAAFAIPAVYLLANGLLFNPVIVDAITEAGGTWLEATTVITGVVIVGIVVFDAIDGFRKVHRGLRARDARAG
jgi:hypothetical protein